MPGLLLLLWLCGGAIGRGQTNGPAPPAPLAWHEWLRQTDRLTGTWGGLRTRLEDHGLRFSLYYNQFFAFKDNGGLDPQSSGAHSGSVDLFGQVDFEKLKWIRGGELLLQAKAHYGSSINPEVGALGEPMDDADGDRGPYVNQWYYQQSSPARRWQARVGYLDPQTMLDRNEYANSEDKQFMNTYLDNNNATIPLAVGPGAAVFINPNEHLSFVLSMANAEAEPYHGSLDTTFDGDWEFFGYFETGLHVRIPGRRGPLPGHYRLGLVYDPRDKTKYGSDPADPEVTHRDVGFYLSLDQMVRPEADHPEEGLGLFARYGWRWGEVNRLEHFCSGGWQYLGLLPSRDQDVLGLGIYVALGSDAYREEVNLEFDHETGYEAYYQVQVTPAFTITPGIQYITQPGALTSRPDTLLGALRLRFTF